MKVLLVEDNERVTQFVVKGLKESGHTVDHADNGRDGMFLAASEPYDVIIRARSTDWRSSRHCANPASTRRF